MRFVNRSPVTVILLSVFTCGIYSIYWMVTTQNDLRRAYVNKALPGGATVFFLTIITCGIYSLYWMYCTAGYLNELLEEDGQQQIDQMMYTIIGFFLTQVGFNAMVQSKLNLLSR